MANRAVRFRIYPGKMQKALIMKTVGSCRFVYNDALNAREFAYKDGKKIVSTNDLIRRLPELKRENPWLREVDSIALQQSIRHLGTAYENFFSRKTRSKRPKYKTRRKSRWSYTTVLTNHNIRIGDNCVVLPKLGRIKAAVSRKIPDSWSLKSATVCVERDYTVYVSFLFEYKDNTVLYVPDSSNSVGLDYKSDGLYVDSSGYCCGSPKFFRRAQSSLAKAQRKLRHKQYGSGNYDKQKQQIARRYRHTANQRKDFLHKESLRIANSYDIVCIEDLDMKAMASRSFGNGKATLDNGWGMFTGFLGYKLRDRGKILIRVDKYYASSQICSCCGTINPAVKDLAVRNWTCPSCGTVHNRDANAAVNILREGLRVFEDADQLKAG